MRATPHSRRLSLHTCKDSVYGERGWVDILAWHAPTRTLLVVEVKTELVDVHDTLGVLDRKTRLAPQVASNRGWRPATIASWLVLAEGSTNRHRVKMFGPLLRAALPAGGRATSMWLRAPAGPIRALTFFRIAPVAVLCLIPGPARVSASLD